MESFQDVLHGGFTGQYSHLDFISPDNTKVISYNLCVWEIQETQLLV